MEKCGGSGQVEFFGQGLVARGHQLRWLQVQVRSWKQVALVSEVGGYRV